MTKAFQSFAKNRVVLIDDCWIWKGCKHRDGHGKMTVSGKSIYSHRFMYELIYGKIKKGMVVMHLCDNPSCINPMHLRLGTPKDNTWDMIKKGRNKFIGMSGKNHWNYKGKKNE